MKKKEKIKSLKEVLDVVQLASYNYQQDVRKAFVYVPKEYDCYLTRKLIGELTKDGKKTRARDFAIQILDGVMKELEITEVKEVESKLEERILLSFEFKPYRLGAYKYRIPSPISYEKSRKQSFKRCFKLALKQKTNKIVDKVRMEFVDIIKNNAGATIQKVAELNKLANANKAYQYLLHR